MTDKKAKWSIITCLLLMASTLVQGEDFFKIKERIIRDARIKILSLYISPTLSITNLGHSSNIYSYQDISEPDWTADVGINLSMASILKNRFILKIDEFPYYSLYAKNKNERAFNNKFQFTLFTYLKRFNLNYRVKWDTLREHPNSEFGTRTRRKEKSHAISLDYGRHDRFFLNLYAAQNKKEYNDDRYLGSYDLSRLDQEELRLGTALNKRIFSRTRLSLQGEYYQYRFMNTPDRDGIGGMLSLGIDFPEISRLTGALRLGVRSFSPKNPLYNDLVKPFGSGTVTLQLFRRFKFNFNYLVDHFFSFWKENQYFDEQSLGGGVELYLSRRIKMGCQYQTGNLSFKQLTDGTGTREDDYRRVTLSLGIRIFKKMGIALTYTIYRADSTQLDFTRRYNFIGGNIIHEF